MVKHRGYGKAGATGQLYSRYANRRKKTGKQYVESNPDRFGRRKVYDANMRFIGYEKVYDHVDGYDSTSEKISKSYPKPTARDKRKLRIEKARLRRKKNGKI